MAADELIVDLSNYKDRVGSRVAPDRYRVQVEDVEATKSQAGNPMVNVWFRIIGGEFDGQTIVDRLTLSEKALFRVVGFMQAIGLPTPKKRLKLNIRQFVGKVLDIDVEDGEPYNGRIRSEVRAYIRAAGATGGAAGADLEDEFTEPETSSSETDLPETSATTPPAQAAEAATPKPETVEDMPADGIDLDDIEL